MKDYKNYGFNSKAEAKHAVHSIAFTILLLSIMGWTVVYWPEPEPAPALITPETVKAHTTTQLAEQSYLINEEMKRRAQGK